MLITSRFLVRQVRGSRDASMNSHAECNLVGVGRLRVRNLMIMCAAKSHLQKTAYEMGRH